MKWRSYLLTQGVSLRRHNVCVVLLLLVQGERYWFGLRAWIYLLLVSRNLSVTIVGFLCSRFIICALLYPCPVVDWIGCPKGVVWMEFTSNSVLWGRLLYLFIGSLRGQKSDASKRTRPISHCCMKGTNYSSLGEYTFYNVEFCVYNISHLVSCKISGISLFGGLLSLRN